MELEVTHRSGRWARSIARTGALATALCVGSAGCEQDPLPGEREERPTAEQDVPLEVRLAAAGFCARLGKARCTQWYWDTEDRAWEATVVGLSRTAELDILPDGSFSELELVYDLAEVDAILPEVGRTMRAKSHGEEGLLIELSLRREAFLDRVPELGEAWHLDGVVLEFQGPGRQDFELDARGRLATHPVDDTRDAAGEVRTPPE